MAYAVAAVRLSAAARLIESADTLRVAGMTTDGRSSDVRTWRRIPYAWSANVKAASSPQPTSIISSLGEQEGRTTRITSRRSATLATVTRRRAGGRGDDILGGAFC